MKKSFTDLGFLVVSNVYSDNEVNTILEIIASADSGNSTFRKSADLFAIRQFFKEIPKSIAAVLNKNLINIITNNFGDEYFVTKSIYFDKPEKSNWFVAYHQDLTISVDRKINIADFGPGLPSITNMPSSHLYIYWKIISRFVFILMTQLEKMGH